MTTQTDSPPLDLDALDRLAREAQADDEAWYTRDASLPPRPKADFIAALSPAVVLALCARVRRAEEDAARRASLIEHLPICTMERGNRGAWINRTAAILAARSAAPAGDETR